MRNEGHWIVTGLSLAAAMVTFVGCQTTPKDERSEGLALDDKHITERVKKSLESEPTYKFTDVDVRTFAGIVQLSGFVNSPDQKNRAQEIAQHTEGTREVVNAITLKPPMPTATSRPNAEPKIYSTPQSSSAQPDNKTNPTTEPK